MTDEGIIYIATHGPTGKQYVGQTTKPVEERIYQHLIGHKRAYFSSALKKHGLEQFSFQCIPCPVEQLDDMETLLISELETKKPFGFNVADGGKTVRGFRHSPESRRKISLAATGKNHPHAGTPRTEEEKQRLSMLHSGKVLSEETKRKIALAGTGKHPTEATRRKIALSLMGHAHSEEMKKILRAANLGKTMSPETRKKMSAAKTLYWGRKRGTQPLCPNN